MICGTRFSVRAPGQSDSALFCAGVRLLAWLTLAANMSTVASDFQSLHSFDANSAGGQRPYAGVVYGKDGLLYGTTFQGGTNGGGTVFKVQVDGNGYAVLHHFSTNALDGQSPGGLMLGSDGALYGTTAIGGAHKAGTVYRIHRDASSYTLLYQFGAKAGDGQNPQSELTERADGTLCGTTFFGGGADSGTVFGLKKDGTGYQLLAQFSGNNGDGANPDAALARGTNDTLYGTTFFGGPDDLGTVFKVNADGSGTQILHAFSRSAGDGTNPDAALLLGADGVLYGTSSAGGAGKGGTVFKLNIDGNGFTNLHQFGSSPGDGQKPLGGLVESPSGALAGTTYLGGSGNAGTIFQVHKDGTRYSVLHNFTTTNKEGQNPRSTLALGSEPGFYGTTWSGGSAGFGTVFLQALLEAPQMLELLKGTEGLQLQFRGASGERYQLLHSTDVRNWTALETVIMPAEGVYAEKVESSREPAGFHRVSWTP